MTMDEKTPEKKIPKQSELVIAQVTKITNFGAYCRLPEYDNMEVFLPIREVSSGWIKNIRIFIHEGQKLVCMVVFFDKEKNTIDISLKKVTAKAAKEKIGAYNLENRLIALVNQVLKGAKDPAGNEKVIELMLSEFGSYAKFAQAAVKNSEEFKKSRISKNIRDTILKAIEANMKKKEVDVSYILTLTTSNTKNGVSLMKKMFKEMKGSGAELVYISAPKYRLYAVGKDYAEAESKVKKALDVIRAGADKSFTFETEKEKLKREKEGIIEQYMSR